MKVASVKVEVQGATSFDDVTLFIKSSYPNMKVQEIRSTVARCKENADKLNYDITLVCK